MIGALQSIVTKVTHSSGMEIPCSPVLSFAQEVIAGNVPLKAEAGGQT
jgi:hypothetical protein